jgi:predicted CopG family antitoxin
MSTVERTTISVRDETHRRLRGLKPYDSVSFDELLQDMADHYEADA